MTLRTKAAKAQPIGIDLGTSSVKVAQVTRGSGDGTELIAAGSCEIPREARGDFRTRLNRAGSGLRRLLRTAPFKSRQCVISLPADVTFVHHVKIPKLSAEETPKALRWELQGKLPYPVDQAIIRHLVAGEAFGDGEIKQEMIVVAAHRSVIEAALAMTHKLKLDVLAVNIEPCAIVECFSRLFRRSTDAARTILYIDMGTASTQVVLSHGAKIVFAKNLPVGGDAMDQAVADKLQIPFEHARTMRRNLLDKTSPVSTAEEELYCLLHDPLDHLTQELTQCLRYYESVFRNQGVERVIFLGGQSHDKRLCQAIAQRLNLPAQIGDPLVRIERAQGIGFDSQDPRPEFAVAVGLSLGAEQAA